MANIVELKDATSTKCYPITKGKAVYFSDNSTANDLKDSVNGSEEFLNYKHAQFTLGGAISMGTSDTSLEPVTSASLKNYSYAIIPCSPGDEIILTCAGGTTDALSAYAFLGYRNSNSNTYATLFRSGANTSFSNETITAPAGALYCVVNHDGDASDVKYALIKCSEKIVWSDGYLQNTSGATCNPGYLQANASYTTAFSRCNPGDKFLISGTGGGNARLYAFTDSYGYILSASDPSITRYGITITAPEGSAWIILNAGLGNTAGIERSNICVKISSDYGKIKARLPIYKDSDEMKKRFTKDDVYCYILTDDTYYGESFRGNYYRYIDYGVYQAVALDNGGYADLIIPEFVPMKSNSECADYLIDIAASYGSNVGPYEAATGPFRTDGAYTSIQCSQFANALMQGLYYQNSKMVGKTENEFINGGCKYLKQSTYENPTAGAMAANEMAHFAAAHGWFKLSKTLKNTEVGDVLFFIIDTAESRENGWLGIRHAAVVIAKDGHKTYFVNSGKVVGNPLITTDSWQWKANSAINVQMFDDDEAAAYANGRGLIGYARFPLTYGELTQSQQSIISHFE